MKSSSLSRAPLHNSSDSVNTMDPSGQLISAGQRRKQRRLRSWWRHEQQTVAAVLAAFTHHSALRGPKKEVHCTAEVRKTPHQPVLFKLFDEEPGGVPPEAFVEPRSQELVQRHVVEHITDLVRVAPMVQILDAPVPQTVEQQPDILRFLDTLMPDPEQVIEVPKILSEGGARYAAGGTAGGSAEDRILFLFAADFGAAHRHSSSWLWMECETLVFKVFPLNRVQQRRFLLKNAFLSGLWSRSLISPFLVEAFKIFAQDRVHPQFHALQLIGSTLRMRHVKGFFARFPVQRSPGTQCESAPARKLIHVVCLWPAQLGGRRHGLVHGSQMRRMARGEST